MISKLAEKQSLICECVSSKIVNEEIVVLEFLWAGAKPAAGQFFLIKPQRTSVFLARPFSVAFLSVDALGRFIVRFVILKRGRGTEELFDFRAGEKAELIGPLGNTWASVVLRSEEPVALVSGGVGVAALSAYAKELEENEMTFDLYAGFKNKSYGLDEIKARKLVVAIENSSEGDAGIEGQKGRILDFFSPADYSAVFACGPLPMLKILAKTCEEKKVPCFVSMEKKMACGTGACLGCTIKTRSVNKRCCADGPIFNAMELNFE